jgi:hypothetical protein
MNLQPSGRDEPGSYLQVEMQPFFPQEEGEESGLLFLFPLSPKAVSTFKLTTSCGHTSPLANSTSILTRLGKFSFSNQSFCQLESLSSAE